jgi:hypothetical protein
MAQHIIELTAEQEMEFLIGWATQTVAFSLSLTEKRADRVEPDAPQLGDVSHGHTVAIELWRDALAQCGAVSEQVGATFLQNVFRWCEHNFAAAHDTVRSSPRS